jgi:predicted PhzF superfamily epimerase YddE/YHI9
MEYVVVDAFTATPFAGNPACVILLPRTLQDATMLAIARCDSALTALVNTHITLNTTEHH